MRLRAVGRGANCDEGGWKRVHLPLLAALPRVLLYYRCALRRGPSEGPGLRVRAEAGILLCYVMFTDGERLVSVTLKSAKALATVAVTQ